MHPLLMITIELPYPANSGGRIKSWNMLKFLGNHFDLSLVCPMKYGTDELEQFKSRSSLKYFYYDAVEVPRSGKNLLRSYTKCVPLNVYRSASERLKQTVQTIAHEYPIILLDHYESFQYLPEDYKGKVILHTHNATYLMWERYAQADGNIAIRAASAIEARRVKSYERLACNRADLVFASPNDIDNLAKLGCDRARFRETYHLGDDSQLALQTIRFENTERALLYVGTLNWEANVDGLLWFLDQVWPALKRKQPELRFDIVGGSPDQRIIDAAELLADVNLLGFVDDLEPLFQRSRLFIAPLRFGSGIKVKVLNTMCRGIPVITTSVGSEGIAAEHFKHLSITDDAESMEAAIVRLLDDSVLWQSIEHQSRELIRKNYTWKRVLGYMVDEISALNQPQAESA